MAKKRVGRTLPKRAVEMDMRRRIRAHQHDKGGREQIQAGLLSSLEALPGGAGTENDGRPVEPAELMGDGAGVLAAQRNGHQGRCLPDMREGAGQPAGLKDTRRPLADEVNRVHDFAKWHGFRSSVSTAGEQVRVRPPQYFMEAGVGALQENADRLSARRWVTRRIGAHTAAFVRPHSVRRHAPPVKFARKDRAMR
ncbi:MAG: hypothetical protein AB7E81_17935 [Hyphomicrobiaceae bacterium]